MTAYTFFKSVNIKNKLLILKTFLDLPACLIHELFHILVALLLFVKIKKVKCLYFYKVEENVLKTYGFHVVTTIPIKNKVSIIKGMLVNIAPVFCILLLFISPYFIIYLSFSYKMFLPSPPDIVNFKNNLQSLKDFKK